MKTKVGAAQAKKERKRVMGYEVQVSENRFRVREFIDRNGKGSA